jgi:hypothetical protein
MTARRQFTANNTDETLAVTARLVRESGAAEFELAYDATNRRLKPNEDVGPDDEVRWTATASLRTPFGVATRTGTALVAPGGDHGRGVAYACVRLLEALGANTVVVDMNAGTEMPR